MPITQPLRISITHIRPVENPTRSRLFGEVANVLIEPYGALHVRNSYAYDLYLKSANFIMLSAVAHAKLDEGGAILDIQVIIWESEKILT